MFGPAVAACLATVSFVDGRLLPFDSEIDVAHLFVLYLRSPDLSASRI